LRKAKNIKALILLLSWVVIFAHSVVPHNHHETDAAFCQNLVHSHSSDVNQTDNIVRIENLPCAEKVCHLNGFEYFQLNTDNLFLINDKSSQAYTCEIYASTSFRRSPEFVSDPHLGKPDLRAPPLS
jgi:hypothetical protein